MNRLIVLLTFAALLVGSSLPVSAMDKMHGSMMMPTCAATDPAVMVNKKTKTYMMADKAHMKMSSMHKSSMTDKTMMKNQMTMMCKSQADAMGAQMMKGGMKGHT